MNQREYYETKATEAEFLEWYKNQDLATYEKPSVTIDNLLFAFDKETDEIKMLLIQRKNHPYINKWSLTGGFVNPTEDTTQACLRETLEEVGLQLTPEQTEQLYTFSKPGRDPRTWVISVAHLTFLPTVADVVASDDAEKAAWFTLTVDAKENITLTNGDTVLKISNNVEENNALAFDHAEMIQMAVQRIKGKMYYQPNILHILGETFILNDIRKVFAVFEGVDYKTINRSNFRRTYGHLFEEVGKLSDSRGTLLYKLK